MKVTKRKIFNGWMRKQGDIDKHLAPDLVKIEFGLVKWNDNDFPCRITIEWLNPTKKVKR